MRKNIFAAASPAISRLGFYQTATSGHFRICDMNCPFKSSGPYKTEIYHPPDG